MAKLIACMAMSHGPQLMVKPADWHLLRNRQGENLPAKPAMASETDEVKQAKWDRCMNAISELIKKLAALKPDVVVLVGDDQHENILDDNTPPFTIFIGGQAQASTSLKYYGQQLTENRTAYRIDAALAAGMLNSLMNNGFDPAYSRNTRYAGGLGHAFARVLKFLSPAAELPIVPVMVNTYFPPVPSPKRCVQFGQALAEAVRSHPGAERVVIVGSGGLSHTKINEALDREFIGYLEAGDIPAMAAMPAGLFVEGTSEILNWIVTAAAANCQGAMVDYQPLYRTPTGVGCAMGFATWDVA